MQAGEDPYPQVRKRDRVDVLLITVDCLRPSALRLSPACESLAGRGAVFTDVSAQAPWTSPALFSLFSGCNPPGHGVTSRGGRVSAGLTLLPALLRNAGWDVPNVCYLNREESYAALGWGPPVAFEEALAQRPLRRLLWTHYERCHLPYSADPPLLERLRAVQRDGVIPRGSIDLRADDREEILTLYESSVRRMDTWLRGVLDAWDDRGPVVLTADHGEEILEHGWIGHASTAEWATLYEEVLRIPLIIHGFGQARVDAPVRQIDILPTLCELLGIALANPIEGRSVVPLIEGRPLPEVASYAESTIAGYRTAPAAAPHRVRALRRGRWKVIESTLGTTELYDLERDSGERTNVAEAHPDIVADLSSEIRGIAEASRTLWTPAPPTAPPAEVTAWPGAIEVASDYRYEVEYQTEQGICGTLYAHGPRISVDVAGRYRARTFDGGWSSWIEVAPRTTPERAEL